MSDSSSGREASEGRRKTVRTRLMVQIVHRDGKPVIRLLNTRTEKVFREVSAAEFIAFARTHRDVGKFLLHPAG